MPVSKPDTSGGFHPTLSGRGDIFTPSVDCVRADGTLDSSLLSPALQQVMLRSTRVRNIVSSMLIEGERVELARAVEVLDTERATTPNERAILQLSRVYDRIARGESIPRTVSGVCSVHFEIFDGVLPTDVAGAIKTERNAIVDVGSGRIVFLPTPPERVRAELDALFRWFNDVRFSLPGPVVAGIFFAEFQAIHPFADGNGRVGRILNLSVLAELGLKNAPLVPVDSMFFRTHRKYYEMLSTTNTGRQYGLWLRYYVRQLLDAYRAALKRTDLRKTVEGFRSRVAKELLMWALSGSGDWFSHGDFPNPTGFSVPAVTQALRKLVHAGVLESKGEHRGRRYRLSPAYLARIDSGLDKVTNAALS